MPKPKPAPSAPSTSGNLALVQAPPVDLTPIAPTAAPLVPPVSPDRNGVGFVDQVGADRVNADRELAHAYGLSTGVEAYERGTTVNEIGVKNARRKRAEWKLLPIAEDGLMDLYETIQKEDRKDEIVQTSKLRAMNDGFLYLVDEPDRKWKVEAKALRDLADDLKSTIPADARFSPSNFAAYLESCPADKRATEWNYWQDMAISQRADLRDAEEKRAASEDKIVRVAAESALAKLDRTPTSKLRSRRDADGNRSIFGTVGEGWVPIDVDHVILMAIHGIRDIEGEIRARLNYSGRHFYGDLITHSNVEPENYVAGEIFQIGFRIGTDDTGGGSIYGYSTITQNLCRNLIILHEAKGNHFRVIHKGDPRVILERVMKGIKSALGAVAAFAPQWTTACNDRLLLDSKIVPSDTMTSDRMRFAQFAANAAGIVTKRSGSDYLLPMPGVSAKERVQRIVPELLRHYAADLKDGSSAVRTAHDGLTRAALVNTLTRFAHESERDAQRGADLENVAGSVLAKSRGTQWALPIDAEWEEYNVTPVDLVDAAKVL